MHSTFFARVSNAWAAAVKSSPVSRCTHPRPSRQTWCFGGLPGGGDIFFRARMLLRPRGRGRLCPPPLSFVRTNTQSPCLHLHCEALEYRWLRLAWGARSLLTHDVVSVAGFGAVCRVCFQPPARCATVAAPVSPWTGRGTCVVRGRVASCGRRLCMPRRCTARQWPCESNQPHPSIRNLSAASLRAPLCISFRKRGSTPVF